MTAQEAITKLTNIMHDDHYSWHPSVLTAFNMAVDALRGLPSAQPEQRWIPVTEKLPDPLQEVLVTSTRGYVYTSRIVHGDFEYGGNVIAWMPLPEPYKDDPCNGCDYLGESCAGEGCGKLTVRKEGEADDAE